MAGVLFTGQLSDCPCMSYQGTKEYLGLKLMPKDQIFKRKPRSCGLRRISGIAEHAKIVREKSPVTSGL